MGIPTKDWTSVNSHPFCPQQSTRKSSFPWKHGCAEWEASVRADRPHPSEVPRPGNLIKEGTRQERDIEMQLIQKPTVTPELQWRSGAGREVRSGPKSPTTKLPGIATIRVPFPTLLTEKIEIALVAGPLWDALLINPAWPYLCL